MFTANKAQSFPLKENPKGPETGRGKKSIGKREPKIVFFHLIQIKKYESWLLLSKQRRF